MRDYLSDFLTPDGGENLKTLEGGKAQKARKSPATFGNTQRGQGSKGSKGTFDTFDTSTPGTFPEFHGDSANAADLNRYGENVEMHDSALFDVIVEVDFYDGRRFRIPQQSTPEGWTAPF